MYHKQNVDVLWQTFLVPAAKCGLYFTTFTVLVSVIILGAWSIWELWQNQHPTLDDFGLIIAVAVLACFGLVFFRLKIHKRIRWE